ncbi:FAD-dependent oxidoreductase [soil metagenome]
MRRMTYDVCIVGGGPAGMMCGLLLARAGLRTVVLEKHADFLRDFRGDTVHPSTLRALDDIGLLDDFLALPHSRLDTLYGYFGEQQVRIADFSGLPARYGFIAMMPQWDLLDFLAARASRYDSFELRRRARATGLLEAADGRITGVRGESDAGPFEVEANCTIACDGRDSTIRAAAGFVPHEIGATIEVLWFRVTRDVGVGDSALARVSEGHFAVTIDRGDYWQVAFVIAKGGADAWRRRDIGEFRQAVAGVAPVLLPHLGDIGSWDDVKLLTVTVNRLDRWARDGLLCIGDAAHAMSPVGGVGINLAVQDAIATANLLAEPLREGRSSQADLEAVQRRRAWPTRATQAVQVAVQNRLLLPLLSGARGTDVPLPLKLVSSFPAFQRLFARAVGMGVRPERIASR